MGYLTASKNAISTALNEVYHNPQKTEGQFVRRFEDLVSTDTGLHCIAFNSGGTALFSLARAMKRKVNRKQKAYVPYNTFLATATMPYEAGFDISFIDPELDTFSISVGALTDQFDKQRPDLVVLTHVGGGIARDYERIAHLCHAHGVPLIEDAAHAVGAKNGYVAGALSEGAAFSLYPTKAVPVGEGGYVLTRSKAMAARLSRFRNYGKFVDEGVVRYGGGGFNFRMDEWTAAVAYHQYLELPKILAQREELAQRIETLVPSAYRPQGIQNRYKFPVSVEGSEDFTRTSGHVYQASDQAGVVMNAVHKSEPSQKIAESYKCLAVDVHACSHLSINELTAWLRSAYTSR